MKKVKITLELNAIELNVLLTGIEAKWSCNYDDLRTLNKLAQAIERANSDFDIEATDFDFEVVSTAALYRQLFELLEQFPEIKDNFCDCMFADSESEFRRAVTRARKVVEDIPAPQPKERVKAKAPVVLASVLPFSEVAS